MYPVESRATILYGREESRPLVFPLPLGSQPNPAQWLLAQCYEMMIPGSLDRDPPRKIGVVREHRDEQNVSFLAVGNVVDHPLAGVMCYTREKTGDKTYTITSGYADYSLMQEPDSDTNLQTRSAFMGLVEDHLQTSPPIEAEEAHQGEGAAHISIATGAQAVASGALEWRSPGENSRLEAQDKLDARKAITLVAQDYSAWGEVSQRVLRIYLLPDGSINAYFERQDPYVVERVHKHLRAISLLDPSLFAI